ncbi:MAG: hypothetical protein N3E39_00070 [Candidatus Methanomethylicia archaeon]|nr:hypothetical protein [Candidatus Methanomethylicia archaeon]
MVIIVRVKLKTLKGKILREIESVAVANTGYESEESEIVLPIKVAEKLGLWLKLPEETKVELYEVTGGMKIRIYN